MQPPDRYRAATLIQAAFRGYRTRKRNANLDLEFAALVAEIEPEKLLRFWDVEALSRRNYQQIASKGETVQTYSRTKNEENQAVSSNIELIATEEEKELPNNQESRDVQSYSYINSYIMDFQQEDHGNLCVTKEQLDSKRLELLNDLWWLQHSIISRRQNLSQRTNKTNEPQN
ncbi:Oidioi.mRNA.OKI2018_I69.chr1.g2019.t1.cds [Oikopleura dioica]|uniref:Oidioi.mRNA.OKI2018_I69.chr1.g2019.t1.cds n=1 Tax=Oikopleura dioica TaxID=34765 RepID=A0ABN7SU11_OIKDI|nr:Oidioi.mRNA.OKI2018_I69.chr1.g2019.t1.cds [Oikopleura dioica]